MFIYLLLGDRGDPALQDGEIGDLGEDEDPGLVVVDKLILLRLSSLGVRSTVILGLRLFALESREEVLEHVEETGEEQFAPAAFGIRAGDGERERRRKEQFPL